MENREIEVRFLEIDKEGLIKRLRELGAEDRGEIMLEETILYNNDLSWADMGRRVRIRRSGDEITLTYKERVSEELDGNIEIEFGINNAEKAEIFLEKVGLRANRKQQKLRHTFVLDGVIIDIDTWPRVPTYVELEGESEEVLRQMATKLGFDWKNVVTKNAGQVLEECYNIPVRKMRFFTFDRFE